MELTLLASGFAVGEAPVWDFRENALYWADHGNRRVHRLGPSGRVELVLENLHVGGMALNEPGGLVIAGNSGLFLWRRGSEPKLVANRFEGVELKFNDIKAAPHGGVYAGTLHYPDGLGALYHFAPDGSIEIVQGEVELSNGMGFSPDGSTFYYVDSARREIYAYDYDRSAGKISNRRVLVKIATTDGVPDGMAVDAEGNLWVALWYGGGVVRFSPAGAEIGRIRTGDTQTASLCFGGADLRDVYIVGAGAPFRSKLEPHGYDPQPGDYVGGLFRMRSAVAGLPVPMASLREGGRAG